MIKIMKKIYIYILFLLQINTVLYANNLIIGSVEMTSRFPNSNQVVIEFDVSWDNAWKNVVSFDAVWITIRLMQAEEGVADNKLEKKLCQVVSVDQTSNSNVEVKKTDDRIGIFVKTKITGTYATQSVENIRAAIDYSTCGYTSSSTNIKVFVNGVEMVYIAEGAFYAGDGQIDNVNGVLRQGSST